MKINIEILSETVNSTLSTLKIDGVFVCFVIEDGFRAVKESGETRIIYGEYPLEKRFDGRHFEKYSKKYGHDCTFQIMDVPMFEWIMIHIGNRVIDTDGCLLLNSSCYLDTDGNYRGQQSEKAYLKFYDIVRPRIDSEDVVVNLCR